MHWHTQVHKAQCRHTDEEEDHPGPAAPDDSEEGEPQGPAPPKPEAHWHSAKGHWQSHNASQSDSPE